ncbi:uncharacterized protein ACIBXB_015093 [Morphnus guianensis]
MKRCQVPSVRVLGMSCHKRASINCPGQSLVLRIRIILLPAGSGVPGAASLPTPGEPAAQRSGNMCAGACSPPSCADRTSPLAGLQSSPASQGPQGIRHLSGTRRDWENAGPTPSFLTESSGPPSSASCLCTASVDAVGGLGKQIMSLVHGFRLVPSDL